MEAGTSSGPIRQGLERKLLAPAALQKAVLRKVLPLKERLRANPTAGLETIARKFGTAAVGLTMCAVTAADGTVVVSIPRAPAPPLQTPVFHADPRIARLEAFFDSFGCPSPRHVADYLRVADTYGIDYRILPALSVRESTCGLYQQMNNRWGWDNARSGFGSIPAGIEYVARQLAEAPQYKGKSLDQLLWTYNPLPPYPGEVKKLMQKIEE
jgi:hypothetical protein